MGEGDFEKIGKEGIPRERLEREVRETFERLCAEFKHAKLERPQVLYGPSPDPSDDDEVMLRAFFWEGENAYFVTTKLGGLMGAFNFANIEARQMVVMDRFRRMVEEKKKEAA